ncbi:MAG: radical SAM protein [Gammaproteobacteria bacterium]|nr:radical SAM protein [Gammaproteobacteria bacterium]
MKRKYEYYELTNALCSKCLKKVEAKVIFENENVYLLKHCFEHGQEKVLISTDIEYYKKCRNLVRHSDMPLNFNTKIEKGCPFDCGLCPDHEQHSCLTLVEITDRCNMECPTCYSESSPTCGEHRSMDEIGKMLDLVVKNEGEPDVVQLSGGEPTIHPNFFEILEMAKEKPIRHLMINTNGIRIAKDTKFVKKLATYKPGIEVYLQFDSFNSEVLKNLRGEDVSEIRKKAIDNLNQYNISTTLVVVLNKGLNDSEVGEVIDFASKQRCIRGVSFQPTQAAGRIENFDSKENRLTLSEIRQNIIENSLFSKKDLIPVPCNPDCLAMAYALKLEGKLVPLSDFVDPATLMDGNSITYEKDSVLKEKLFKLYSAGAANSSGEDLKTMLCCLPKISTDTLSYDNVFRILIIKFYDAYDLDVRGVKRSCVHIVNKKGDKIIPFDTMNLLYREK